MRVAAIVLCLALGATPAFATPVSLVDGPMDDDGVVTLGELFDNAGLAAGVRVATRTAAPERRGRRADSPMTSSTSSAPPAGAWCAWTLAQTTSSGWIVSPVAIERA